MVVEPTSTVVVVECVALFDVVRKKYVWVAILIVVGYCHPHAGLGDAIDIECCAG